MCLHLTPKTLITWPWTLYGWCSVQLSPVLQIQSNLSLPEVLVPALSSGNSVLVAPHVGAHGDVRSPHFHPFSQPIPNIHIQSKKPIVTCFLRDKCRVRTRPLAPLQT